jgi:hypothetical protein
MQYNDIIYTPGKQTKKPQFSVKDPVLDQAVDILTGKITLEEAKAQAQKAAEKRKAAEKKENKEQEPETSSANTKDK